MKEGKKARHERLDARLDDINKRIASIDNQIELISHQTTALAGMLRELQQQLPPPPQPPRNVNLQAAAHRGRDRRP